MLQDGKVLGTHLTGETGLLDYGGQHSYHIIQYVINLHVEFNVCACNKP